MPALSALEVIEVLLLSWLLLGGIAVFAGRGSLVTRFIFPASAVLAAVAAITALSVLNGAVYDQWLQPLGWSLHLDALSAWFFLMLAVVVMACSMYAASYFRHREAIPAGMIAFSYHVFVVAMGLVLLAGDVWMFMLAWELMAVSSYLLVIANHAQRATRQAGLLYLVMAHIGALALLVAFLGLFGGGHEHLPFAVAGHAPWLWSVIFLLALFGFAAKAGMLPLHVWLPEAHPAAPSPVSALMSGLMLKMALYGLLRLCFCLLPPLPWIDGVLLLLLGLLSALYAVVYAAVQIDMKRLLAYSSIENMGLMLLSVGLALVFRRAGMADMTRLALSAALYLAMSHAMFKSLLFLVTGSVLHATGERNLGHLGGLMRRMPWTAWLALVGVFSAAGTPLFGGFAAEWLMLQSFLFTPHLPNATLDLSLPVLSASLVLISALAAYTQIKFFATVFLGQHREAKLHQAMDARARERWAMLLLAIACLVLGLAPSWILPHLQATLSVLGVRSPLILHSGIQAAILRPVAARSVSYAPLILFVCLLFSLALVLVFVRLTATMALRRAPLWGCGFAMQDGARLQDSAEGIGQPIRHIFEPLMSLRRHLPEPEDRRPFYRVEVFDKFWMLLYRPLLRALRQLQRWQEALQVGLTWYLGVSFLVLIVLLGVVTA